VTTSPREATESDRSGIHSLLGLWAVYLAFAVVMGLGTGDVRVFFFVGFAVPALLVAVFAFAALLVAVFVLTVIAASRVASWGYHRFLWDRLRFHYGAWAVPSKGVPKVEDRRRTGWGLIADGLSGLVMGMGFGGVICVPFLGTGVLSGHFWTEAPPWLTGFAEVMLAMGMGGSAISLLFRLASDPLWDMTRKKAAKLPPPVDEEFF
jgi:hypothetical protein